MNTINKLRLSIEPTRPASLYRLRAACGCCYQGALGRLPAVKVKVEREFGQAMAGYDRLLKAALNEAEALAWQTPYPHLLFPVLAEEKAAEAQHWAAHQRAMRNQSLREQPQLELVA